jgi:hypothetical protein
MVLTCFTLLMPAFSLLVAPHALADRASLLPERSPTTVLRQSLASVTGLSPVTLSAQERLTSELLRTL